MGSKNWATGSAGLEILFEFTQIGNNVRVTAVDAASGAEAVIIGPASSSAAELRRVATQKLRYIMEKSGAKDKS
mgnify:CR=1 FL=1